MANNLMTLTKAAVSAATAGAMLCATPATARDRRHDNDGINAGEVIAGAVILGGLAAILSSGDRSDPRYPGTRYGDRYDDRSAGYDNQRYDDRYTGGYGGGGYGGGGNGYDRHRYGNSRQAVNQCVNAVEQRSGRWGRTDVTEIRDIDRTRDGYRVEGRVVVRDGYRGQWGRGGYHDRGRFTCSVRYGRVDDVRFGGLG